MSSPFTALSIATAISESDCAAQDCVAAATAAIDVCWEQLSQAVTMSMIGSIDDTDDEMPDADLLSLLEVFEAEEGEEFDAPESTEDSAAVRYRKRRQRLAGCAAADWEVLMLVGETLEALFGAYAELEHDSATVMQVVHDIGNPEALNAFAAGESLDNDDARGDDDEDVQFLDWTQLDRLPSKRSAYDED